MVKKVEPVFTEFEAKMLLSAAEQRYYETPLPLEGAEVAGLIRAIGKLTAALPEEEEVFRTW